MRTFLSQPQTSLLHHWPAACQKPTWHWLTKPKLPCDVKFIPSFPCIPGGGETQPNWDKMQRVAATEPQRRKPAHAHICNQFNVTVFVNTHLFMGVFPFRNSVAANKAITRFHKTKLGGSKKEKHWFETNSWNKICVGSKYNYLTPFSVFHML